MKRILCISVLFVLTLGLFYGCSDDEKKDVETFEVTIASVEIPENTSDLLLSEDVEEPSVRCYAPAPSYYMKREGKSEWEMIFPPLIKDFLFEEGYEYVLLVEGYYYDDGTSLSGYRMDLKKQISKVKKDSENIPLLRGSFRVGSKATGDKDYPYYVFNETKNIWLKCPPIEGFTYEEGYEYIVEVNCRYNGVDANPKYTYIYLETSMKEKKDSERLPE